MERKNKRTTGRNNEATKRRKKRKTETNGNNDSGAETVDDQLSSTDYTGHIHLMSVDILHEDTDGKIFRIKARHIEIGPL